jgi:endoglucanase
MNVPPLQTKCLHPTNAASSKQRAPASLPWLHIEGEQIVDEEKKPVILRGMNLGGFLVEEMWMSPFETKPPQNESQFTPIIDHVSLWKTVETRFGRENMQALRQEYRSTWLDEKDLERIKALGFNTVRLPFLYDLAQEPQGMYWWLDWAIERANKLGMYVILDLHGAPGRQSNAQHTGQANCSTLFTDYTKVQKTVELWTEIATRYKDQPGVAGYDLLNEPMAAANHASLYVIYEKLYNAIRQVDDKHIIFMEDGYKGFEYIPTPAHVGWNQVSLSVHAYAFDQKTEEECLQEFQKKITSYAKYQKERSAPFYLGEFNVEPSGNHQTIHKILSLVEKQGISWSFWAYKVVTSHERKESLWGLYTANKSITVINPFVDSLDEFSRKIQNLKTECFDENKSLAEVFQRVAEGVLLSPEPPAIIQPQD